MIYNDRNVGDIIDGEFVTYRTSKHFMRKYQGFGISDEVLKILTEQNIKVITIIYDGVRGKIIYRARIRQFTDSPKTHVFMDTDLQRFVSARDMKQIKE